MVSVYHSHDTENVLLRSRLEDVLWGWTRLLGELSPLAGSQVAFTPIVSASSHFLTVCIQHGKRELTMTTSASNTYWATQERSVTARDLGHLCRECKKPFANLGDAMTVRRGGRIEMRYHSGCYSGTADPRSQQNSSFHQHQNMSKEAPTGKYRKMRTASQF